MEIPLAEHATADEKMLAPKLEARMLQELAVKASIGCSKWAPEAVI